MQADSGEVTSGLVTNSWTTRRVMKLNTGDRCRGAMCRGYPILPVYLNTAQGSDHAAREEQGGLLHGGELVWGERFSQSSMPRKQKTG